MLFTGFLSRIHHIFKSRVVYTLPLLVFFSCQQQPVKKATQPKLVVGIVVDQMRFDYLERFAKDFKNHQGFQRFIESGKQFTNTRYSYLPTYTGPGHATIFTGTTPKYHGIIANDWYSHSANKMMYCASDSTVNTVGSPSGSGEMSPKHLNVASLGDAFKNHFGEASIVYGISLKDRGAIFPAGKKANRAFWFDGGKQGKWISSDYYTSEFPNWVNNYNTAGKTDELLSLVWNTDSAALTYNVKDSVAWERPFRGLTAATFPYELSKLALSNGNYELLKQVPYGNNLTLDFAKELVKNEALGKDSVCDFLSVSFSATDYVGHRFGTESLELVDTYLKLDTALESFFAYLDTEVGNENYVVFLTADHGATPPAAYSLAKHNRGGAISMLALEMELDSFLVAKGLPVGSVKSLVNQQVYLNQQLDSAQFQFAMEALTNYLSEKEFVEEILPTSMLGKGVKATYSGRHYTAASNGFLKERCGDLWYFLKPFWVEYSANGSTHGSFEESDIHVPFMMFGTGITQQTLTHNIAVSDIAPTVCQQLGITPLKSFTGRSQLQ